MKRTAIAFVFAILLSTGRGVEVGEPASVEFSFGSDPGAMTVVKLSRIWDGTVQCAITFPPGHVSMRGAKEDETSVVTTVSTEDFERLLGMFDQDDIRHAFESDQTIVLDGEEWIFRRRIGGHFITMVSSVGGRRPGNAAAASLATAIVTVAGRPDLLPRQ